MPSLTPNVTPERLGELDGGALLPMRAYLIYPHDGEAQERYRIAWWLAMDGLPPIDCEPPAGEGVQWRG